MIFKPPHHAFAQRQYPAVFLAGSIEMGEAPDWQATAADHFDRLDFTVFNPRRDDWDSSWEQVIDNPQFENQVEWELQALDLSNFILFNFVPGTISPISLLELGLHARRRLITEDRNDSICAVVCPTGFHRKGNVDITCRKYRVPQYATIPDAISHLVRLESLWRTKY